MNKIPSIYSIPLQRIHNLQNRLEPNVGALLLCTLDFYEWVAQSQTLFLLSAFIAQKIATDDTSRIVRSMNKKSPSAGDWQSYWFSLAKHGSEQNISWLQKISSSLLSEKGLSDIGAFFQKIPNIRNKVKHGTLPNPNACRTYLENILPSLNEVEKFLVPEVPTFIIRTLQSRKGQGKERVYEYEYYTDFGLENIATLTSERHLREDGCLYLAEITNQNDISFLQKQVNLNPFFYHDGIDGSFPYMYSGGAGSKDTHRYVCTEKQATNDFSETTVGLKKFLLTALVINTEEAGSESSNSVPQRPKTFEIFMGFDDLALPSPERFFSGHVPTWSDLAAKLDVDRSVFVDDQRLPYVEFFQLLKSGKFRGFNVFGEAGSGKTTFLRRLMYDLVEDGFTVLRSYLDISIDVQECLRYVKSNRENNIYIFIDDAPRQINSVAALSSELINYPSAKLVCGSRKNEWNESIKFIKYETDAKEAFLGMLSDEEVEELVSKLNLNNISANKSISNSDTSSSVFFTGSKNQLLVSLLEITKGKRFSEIVWDEYQSIHNTKAKFLYLAICAGSNLGVNLAEHVVQLVSECSGKVELLSEIYPSLELVVSRVRTPRGIFWLPRHRLIGDELIKSYCKEKEDILTIWNDIYFLLSSLKHENRPIQNFASLSAMKISKRRYLSMPYDAEEIIANLLRICWIETEDSTSTKWRTNIRVPFTLNMSNQSFTVKPSTSFHAHPNLRQFNAAVSISRKFLDVSATLRLVNLGLIINPFWYPLKLTQAMIEFERGNTDAANQILEDLIKQIRKRSTDYEMTIPIGFAIDIARFLKHRKTLQAIEYLMMCKSQIYRGMEDSKGYFLLLSELYLIAGDENNFIETLKKGLAFVVGPKHIYKEMYRSLTLHEIQNANDLTAAITEYVNDGKKIPDFVAKLIIDDAIEKSNYDFLVSMAQNFEDNKWVLGKLFSILKSGESSNPEAIYRVIDLIPGRDEIIARHSVWKKWGVVKD